MDTVVVDDKRYIKASKAAADFGYTPDYVGQLCRKGKIDAVIIGKTWYVREESLGDHKKSSDRINTEVTKRDVQKQKEGHLSTTERPRRTVESTHWRKVLETPINYSTETDDTLMPMVSRTEDDVEENQADYSDQVGGEMHSDIHEDDPLSTEEESVEVATPVPIRKQVQASTSSHKPSYLHRRLKGSADIQRSALMSAHKSEIKKVSEEHAHEVVVRRSLLPMIVAGGLAVLLLANIFTEAQWIYGGDSEESASGFMTEYNIASVTTIVEIMKNTELKPLY